MKKNNIPFLSILLVVIFIFGFTLLKNHYDKRNTQERINECSFTKTYRVDNLWTVDLKEETPGMSYVILNQFQNEDKLTAVIPTELRDKLQENKYYEFTYTIEGKEKIIRTMEDINDYFISNDNTSDFKITLTIEETNKKGLEQLNENICNP